MNSSYFDKTFVIDPHLYLLKTCRKSYFDQFSYLVAGFSFLLCYANLKLIYILFLEKYEDYHKVQKIELSITHNQQKHGAQIILKCSRTSKCRYLDWFYSPFFNKKELQVCSIKDSAIGVNGELLISTIEINAPIVIQ